MGSGAYCGLQNEMKTILGLALSRPWASGKRSGVRKGTFPPLDFGHILLNLLVILIFNNEWL